jgi:hypothetical protein
MAQPKRVSRFLTLTCRLFRLSDLPPYPSKRFYHRIGQMEYDEALSEDDFSSEDDYDDDELSDEDTIGYATQRMVNEKDLQPALNLQWKHLVYQTLDELPYVLPDTPSSLRSCTGTQSSRETRRLEQATPPDGSKRTTSSNKVGDNKDKSGNDEGEGDGDGRRRRRRGPSARITSNSSNPKFACPFFKRNPEKYRTVQSCFVNGFISLHRLK